jgi:hypothetical protein
MEAPAEPASGRATAALVLAILSYVLCLGFLTGIPAAILGRIELTAIDEGRAPEAGRTRATIGMVGGLIATVGTCLCGGVYFTMVMLELSR